MDDECRCVLRAIVNDWKDGTLMLEEAAYQMAERAAAALGESIQERDPMCERHGNTIICRRRPRPAPCYVCGCDSEKLCDGPKPGGGTCDRPMCWTHVVKHIPPDSDLCAECARVQQLEIQEVRRGDGKP